MDGSAVVLAATLPVEIRPWSGQIDEFANFMDDNVTLLRALLVWDEERSGSEEDDRSTLAHLQIKTDLLLTLLSAGIRAREPLPPRYPCALRGDSPSACSKRPLRVSSAPVNAPFSWPKSSLSISSAGMAPQLIATKGPSARAEC